MYVHLHIHVYTYSEQVFFKNVFPLRSHTSLSSVIFVNRYAQEKTFRQRLAYLTYNHKIGLCVCVQSQLQGPLGEQLMKWLQLPTKLVAVL